MKRGNNVSMKSLDFQNLRGIIFFSTLVAFIFCLATGKSWGDSFVEKTGIGMINWTDGLVTVKGTGAPPENTPEGQARLMARRAAISDAYRNLAELINGVQVTSETTVKNFVTESDKILTKVQGFIKGAQVVDEKNLSDGTVEVVISVNLIGQDSLGSIVMTEVDIESPPFLPETAPETKEAYSGLIVDARWVDLKPCLVSNVKDDMSMRVYDPGFVDPDVLVAKGYAIYVREDVATKTGWIHDGVYENRSPFVLAFFSPYEVASDAWTAPFEVAGFWKELKKGFKSVKKLVDRVGDNPLIVEALGGKNLKTALMDAIIPSKYKGKIEEARYYYDFLKEAKVAFVLGKEDAQKTGWAK